MAKCLLALGRKSGEIGKAKLPAELILDWMLEGENGAQPVLCPF